MYSLPLHFLKRDLEEYSEKAAEEGKVSMRHQAVRKTEPNKELESEKRERGAGE